MLNLRVTRILALATMTSLATPMLSMAASGKHDARPEPKPVAVAPAAQGGGASITVNGSTNVDGTPATTGGTIFSGSRVTTGAGGGATIAVGGGRVTLMENTDAIVTFDGMNVRVDVICGSASAAAAQGMTFELLTKDDTTVHVQGGDLQVAAEGKTASLGNDEQQTFMGSTRVIARDNASFEAATVLCSCRCAAPATFPTVPVVAAAGISIPLILALVAAGIAGTVIPIVVNNDNPETPQPPVDMSTSSPS